MEKMKRPISVSVVLVRTIYERNIGATSRAMSNMGLERLILIDPKCEITFEAQQAAASGQEAIQNRITYKNWDEFYQNEPDGLRISLTARDGRGRAARDLAETLEDTAKNLAALKEESSDAYPVYLFFGPEDWGLSAEDLKFTHYCCTIPTYGANTSLNLAQAVLLALFILRQTWGGQRAKLDGQQPSRTNLEISEIFPDQTLRTWLSEMGFDISSKKINTYTVIRRMLLQNVPTAKEYGILETVLQQSIRKLKEYNELRKRN